MDAEVDRLREALNQGGPVRPLVLFDPQPAGMDNAQEEPPSTSIPCSLYHSLGPIFSVARVWAKPLSVVTRDGLADFPFCRLISLSYWTFSSQTRAFYDF